MQGSVVECEEPRETLRLIKADGVAVTLRYSDILYSKLISKERVLLQMRNDDEFDLRGRDLHQLLQNLEDRRIFALAECKQGECAPGEPCVTHILGVVFEDLKPKPEPPTAGGLVNYRRPAEIKF